MSFGAEDCAAAVANMLLAITAVGYATVWTDGALRREVEAKLAQRRQANAEALLRQEVIAATGTDLLGDLEDAFWGLGRAPEPGQAAGRR